MAKIVSIHSFRGGTGKSNITANLAVALARQGKRVGVIDTDIQSPGIHIRFGLRGENISVAAYHCEVAAVLSHSDEMMDLASGGIFTLQYPDHPMISLYQQIALRPLQ